MDKVEILVENLKKHGYIVEVVNSKSEVLDTLKKYITKEDAIGQGGSMTLKALGITETLKAEGYDMIELRDGIDNAERVQQTRYSEVFLTSTNAISEKGEFVNIDGRGNRISHMCHGAPKIIYIFGENKITPDVMSAIDRVRNVASPLNAKRLNMNTPCVVDLKCHNCESKDRICRSLLISDRVMTSQTAICIIVKEKLGF